MAGIGFKLQKILSEKTYIATLKGYFFATIISSGPWIFSVITVGFLGLFTVSYGQKDDYILFQNIVVYTYAFSLILTGFIQLVVTRYVSDRLFAEDEDAVLPTFSVGLLVTSAVSFIVSALFYLPSELPMRIKIFAILLFVVTCNIWIVMSFLSTLRNYLVIVYIFGIGYFVSLVGGHFAYQAWGVEGILGAFGFGQLVLMLLLVHRIFAEFKFEKNLSLEAVHYFKKYPALVVIGVMYNVGIWIDKFIFWYHPATGQENYDLFHFSQIYDPVIFLSYLTIIPAMALFMIRIETSFYIQYRDFYGAIVNRMPLSVIREKKQLMVDSIKLSIQRLFIVQGSFSFIMILILPNILNFLHLQWVQKSILQISIASAFLHVLVMFLNIFIQYYDFRKFSAYLTLLFVVSNAGFTYLSIELGFNWYGYGYFGACLLTTGVGYLMLVYIINNLEYLTFSKEPVKSVE